MWAHDTLWDNGMAFMDWKIESFMGGEMWGVKRQAGEVEGGGVRDEDIRRSFTALQMLKRRRCKQSRCHIRSPKS